MTAWWPLHAVTFLALAWSRHQAYGTFIKGTFVVSRNLRLYSKYDIHLEVRSQIECGAKCLGNSLCLVAEYWSIGHFCKIVHGLDITIRTIQNSGGVSSLLIRSFVPAFHVESDAGHGFSESEAINVCSEFGRVATKTEVSNTFAAYPFSKPCSFVCQHNNTVCTGVLASSTNQQVNDCIAETRMAVYCTHGMG